MRYRIIFCLGWLAGMEIFSQAVWADSVTVQFRESAHVRLQRGSLTGRAFPGELRDLDRLIRSKGFLIERTFQHPSLNSFYEIHSEHPTDIVDLEGVLHFYQVIESVTPEEKTVLLSADLEPQQYYLGSMPAADSEVFGGVDAKYAWGVPGGTGQGITVVDYEKGWELTHDDLHQDISLIFGYNSPFEDYRRHGTRVLGVLGGVKNGIGVTGIAYQAGLKVASQGYGMKNGPSLEEIVEQLAAGDILLLELGSAVCPTGLDSESCMAGVPVETIPAVFSVIQLATAKGVTVVEAAGNAGLDLDQPAFAWTLEGEDSGAIMVGAGLPGALSPQGNTNYGMRVDVQGFGEGVVTTDLGNGFTDAFSDTSSAAAVVAGVAASLQGVAKAKGVLLSPAEMRDILKNTGIAQQASGQLIGPLPNLKNAIAALPEPAQKEPSQDPPPGQKDQPDAATLAFLQEMKKCLLPGAVTSCVLHHNQDDFHLKVVEKPKAKWF